MRPGKSLKTARMRRSTEGFKAAARVALRAQQGSQTRYSSMRHKRCEYPATWPFLSPLKAQRSMPSPENQIRLQINPCNRGNTSLTSLLYLSLSLSSSRSFYAPLSHSLSLSLPLSLSLSLALSLSRSLALSLSLCLSLSFPFSLSPFHPSLWLSVLPDLLFWLLLKQNYKMITAECHS